MELHHVLDLYFAFQELSVVELALIFLLRIEALVQSHESLAVTPKVLNVPKISFTIVPDPPTLSVWNTIYKCALEHPGAEIALVD